MRGNKLSAAPGLLVAVAALLFLAAAEPAAADRWVVKGKLGQARVDAAMGTDQLRVVDDEDSSSSVEAGWSVFPWLGIQAGYHDFGRHDGFVSPCPPPSPICPTGVVPTVLPQVTRTEVTGFSLALTPRWPVSERFALYGKVGVLDWEAETTAAFGEGRRRMVAEDSDRDLLAGIGAEYSLWRGLGVFAEYEQSEPDLDSTSVGASWRF